MSIHFHAARFQAVALIFFQTLYLLIAAPAQAGEQAPDLFIPLPAGQAADGTPEQSQRLARIKKRPTSATVELVQVDVSALQQERTRIAVPGAEPMVMSRHKLKARDGKNFTWQGSLPDFPGASTLVVRNGNITGSIHDSEGHVYRVEPVGGGAHALIRIDPSGFPPEGEPKAGKQAPRSDSMPAAPYAPLAAAVATPAAPVVIDILVAYTSAARAAVTDIGALVELSIAQANLSYQNSGIAIQLALVDSFEVNYAEQDVTFESLVQTFATSPAIVERRDGSGADMAALLVDNTELCGLAAGVGVPADDAYVVVHYECAAVNYSLAHEFGHLHGARHEPDSDPSTQPFAYGHAFRHETFPAFRTVMATDCPNGCERVPLWSSPMYTFRGVTAGAAEVMDNARVLNETAERVSQFRTRPAAALPALLP